MEKNHPASKRPRVQESKSPRVQESPPPPPQHDAAGAAGVGDADVQHAAADGVGARVQRAAAPALADVAADHHGVAARVAFEKQRA